MFKNNPINLNNSQINNTSVKEINVKVKELVLTPLTCASVINEIIKYLIYQKSQVPYPYNWLKSVVSRKRKDPEHQTKSVNFAVERHYHVVSTAYEALQELIKNVNSEFKNYGDSIKQILVLFGSTLYNPKEVFRICVTDLAKGHSEDNHFQGNLKNLHKILKNILFDEDWINQMDSVIPPTNMYVMVQRYTKLSYDEKGNFFKLTPQYSLPSRVKDTVIHLNYCKEADNRFNCCDNLSVFEDSCSNEETDTTSSFSDCSNASSSFKCVHDNSNCNLVWFQANVVLKGFKECFINDVSATELW